MTRLSNATNTAELKGVRSRARDNSVMICQKYCSLVLVRRRFICKRQLHARSSQKVSFNSHHRYSFHAR
eukprot:24940-Eustigmatos_ZCMA.PRE.1